MTEQTSQQAGWGPPPQPPSPKRKRRPGVAGWIGIGVLVFLVIGIIGTIAGGNNANNTNNTSPQTTAGDSGISRGLGAADAADDIVIDKGSLTVDTLDASGGLAKATVTITNHSSKRSDYYIEAVLLNAAGENIGTANALVQAVEPGQVAHTELDGTYTGKLDRLKITQVQRTASD